MNPLKLLRKLMKLVRGGAGAWQVFGGCLLGVVIGMTPGVNLTLMTGLLLLVILNANLGLAMLCFAIGKVLCLTLAPVTFRIGFAMIHGIGLEGLFRAMSDTPVVAVMNLHYYCLIGGLPVALAVGCVLGWLTARTIRLLRLAMKAGADRSEWARRLTRRLPVRILLRLVFGRQKKTMAEMLATRHPVFRKGGVVLCAVLVGLGVVFELLYVDRLVRAGMESGLASAAGAEVNVADVDASLFGGRVRVAGLQVTDRDKPTHNVVQIDTLDGDLSIADLLARRLVLERVEIARLRTDVKRARPGTVLPRPERPEPRLPDVTIGDYFENGRKVLEYLRKAKEYLDEREAGREEAQEPAGKEDLEELARRRGYLALSADSVLARRPGVTIRELKIDDIRIGDVGTYSLAGREVSDKPELNPLPMRVAFRDGKGMLGELALNFAGGQAAHAISLEVPDVAVGDVVRLSDRVPLDISKARADVTAAGEFTRETVALPVVIELREMRAGPRGGRDFLGVDSATAARMFQQVSTLKIVGGLRGPLAGPRPWVDEKALMKDLQGNLAAAGASVLAGLAGKQADRLLGGTGISLDKTGLGGPLKGIGEALKKPGQDTGSEADKPPVRLPASKPADVIKDLFRR